MANICQISLDKLFKQKEVECKECMGEDTQIVTSKDKKLYAYTEWKDYSRVLGNRICDTANCNEINKAHKDYDDIIDQAKVNKAIQG